MVYREKNTLWNQNKKIQAKFTRLSYRNKDYIYVGILPNNKGWCSCDFIDIMSFFGCIGYEVITEKEAKENSAIPTSNYEVFLKLETK